MSDQPKRIGRPPKRSPRELAAFQAAIVADYESGMSIAQIAAKHDESDSYVYRWLVRTGVTLRPQGGSRPGQSRYFG